MRILVIFLLFLSAHMLHLLSKANPFDRCLRKQAYSINRSSLTRYDASVRFSENATIDSLREAIFSSLYQVHSTAWEYRSPSISFDGFRKWNRVADCFKPFHFSTISFEDVSPDNFQCGDFLLLPCDQLILPQRIDRIDLLGCDIPHIKEIVITAENFVTLVPHSDYSSNPFKSSVSTNFSVPPKLLSKYRTDATWSSLRFIDVEGNICSATFNGLPPMEPIKPKQEAIYYTEAANGMTVRVPESKLESWQAEQDRLRNDPASTELTEKEKKLRDAILHELYGKRYSSNQRSDGNGQSTGSIRKQ